MTIAVYQHTLPVWYVEVAEFASVIVTVVSQSSAGSLFQKREVPSPGRGRCAVYAEVAY